MMTPNAQISQPGDVKLFSNISGETYRGVPQKVPVFGSKNEHSISLLK